MLFYDSGIQNRIKGMFCNLSLSGNQNRPSLLIADIDNLAHGSRFTTMICS